MPAAPGPCIRYGRKLDGGTRTRPLRMPFAASSSHNKPTTSHAIRKEPMATAREVSLGPGLIPPCAGPAGVTSGGTSVMRTSSPGGLNGGFEAISRLGVLNSSLRSFGFAIEHAYGLLETGTRNPCNPDANPAGTTVLVGNTGMNPNVILRGQHTAGIETHANPCFACRDWTEAVIAECKKVPLLHASRDGIRQIHRQCAG